MGVPPDVRGGRHMKVDAPLTLCYSYEQIDLRAVSRATWQRSLSRSGFVPALAWIAAIGIFWGFAEALAHHVLPYTPHADLYLWIGAMGGAVVLFASLLFRWRFMRAAMSKLDRASALRAGEHALTLGPQSVRLDTPNTTQEWRWSAVTGVMRAAGGLVIRLGVDDYVAVPAQAFGVREIDAETELDRLIDAIQSWRTAAP